MAKYKIEIDFDAGQEKILKEKANEKNISPEDLLTLLSESTKNQIDQWIRDRVSAKIAKLTPAEQLSRLEYFDPKE